MTLIKKILVIRLSSLGDIILSFPLINKLKEMFPESEIHFITSEKYKDILALNPQINKVITLDKSLKKSRAEIKKEGYDVILDIHKNFRSFYLRAFNSRMTKKYSKQTLKKFLLVKFKINLFKEIIPVYKKYLLTLKKYLRTSDYDFKPAELIFEKEPLINEKYIVIAPASRHFTKTYPAEKFIKFINTDDKKKFVLVGDETDNDKKICTEIESKCKNVINKCGQLNMSELANVLYNSEYVISNDSAVLHYAEALGKKVVAIFGSTVKEFGFFPQLKESKVIEDKELKCRPCTHIGRDKCPKKHFLCMELLIIDN